MIFLFSVAILTISGEPDTDKQKRKTIEKQQMNAKMNSVCEHTLNPAMCA